MAMIRQHNRRRAVRAAAAGLAAGVVVAGTALGSCAWAVAIPSSGYYVNGKFYASTDLSTSAYLVQQLNQALTQGPLYVELNGEWVNYGDFMGTHPTGDLLSAFNQYAQQHPFTLPPGTVQVHPDGSTTVLVPPQNSVNVSNSSAGWPNTLTLQNGTPLVLQPILEDGNAQPVTGLAAADFTLGVGAYSVPAAGAWYLGSGVYQVVFLPSNLPGGTSANVTLSVDGQTVGMVNGVSIGSPPVPTAPVLAGAQLASLNGVGVPQGSLQGGQVSQNLTSTLPNSTYTLVLQATDAAGNPLNNVPAGQTLTVSCNGAGSLQTAGGTAIGPAGVSVPVNSKGQALLSFASGDSGLTTITVTGAGYTDTLTLSN
ncbi:MAG: hypothetical protein K6T26_01670 [Alicyclobacillus sp.]|nr:hypothetical protein [Alicyclobacillus sp.]